MARAGNQRTSAATSRKAKISELLASIEKKLTEKTTKATLADFIRLTQLERELEEDERPREIIITWVDPTEKEDIGA
jgi:hypothetical protein